jgi:hypothetical protein
MVFPQEVADQEGSIGEEDFEKKSLENNVNKP